LGAEVGTADDMRSAVREHVEHGVDVIKIIASGGNLTPGSRPELAQFDPEILRVAVDETHRADLKITAHAHGTPAVAGALSAGVDQLEHVTFMTADGVDPAPPDLVATIVERRVNLSLTVGFVPIPDPPPNPMTARLPALLANLRRLCSSGAPITAGTDAGVTPGQAPRRGPLGGRQPGRGRSDSSASPACVHVPGRSRLWTPGSQGQTRRRLRRGHFGHPRRSAGRPVHAAPDHRGIRARSTARIDAVLTLVLARATVRQRHRSSRRLGRPCRWPQLGRDMTFVTRPPGWQSRPGQRDGNSHDARPRIRRWAPRPPTVLGDLDDVVAHLGEADNVAWDSCGRTRPQSMSNTACKASDLQ